MTPSYLAVTHIAPTYSDTHDHDAHIHGSDTHDTHIVDSGTHDVHILDSGTHGIHIYDRELIFIAQLTMTVISG